MKATLVSTNSLRYLKDVLEEIRDNGDSLDISDALEMVEGFIAEATIIDDATLVKLLETNEYLIKDQELADEEA